VKPSSSTCVAAKVDNPPLYAIWVCLSLVSAEAGNPAVQNSPYRKLKKKFSESISRKSSNLPPTVHQ
jgi:hypothetical protein